MGIHLRVQAQGFRGERLQVGVFFLWDDHELMIAAEDAPSHYRAPTGELTVQVGLLPNSDDFVWEDLVLYLPYDCFPLPEDDREGYVTAQVFLDGVGLAAVDEKPRFDIPEPATPPPSATIEVTQLEFGVSHEGQRSMGIHLRLQAQGYRDEPLRVHAYFFWDDGEYTLVEEDVPNRFQTTEGQLAVSTIVTPNADNFVAEDLVLHVPYAYFPSPEVDRNGYVSGEVSADYLFIATADEKPRFHVAGHSTQNTTSDNQANQGGGSSSGLYTSPGGSTSSTPSTNQGGGTSSSTTGAAVDCEALYDGLFSQLTTNQYAVGGYLDDDLDYHDPVISAAGCAILLERLDAIDALGCNLALVTSSYQQQSDASDAAYDSCKRRHPDDWDRTCRAQYFSYQIATTQLVEFQELGIWNTDCRRRN